MEFDPDQVFCYGCKAPGKPVNVAHAHCTVLKCSVARGLESCLQCNKLADCDKDKVCEASLLDVHNCGVCGNECKLANATAVCRKLWLSST